MSEDLSLKQIKETFKTNQKGKQNNQGKRNKENKSTDQKSNKITNTNESCFISFDTKQGVATAFAIDFTLKNKSNIELPSKYFEQNYTLEDFLKKYIKDNETVEFKPIREILGDSDKKWKPCKLIIRNIHYEDSKTETNDEENSICMLDISSDKKKYIHIDW